MSALSLRLLVLIWLTILPLASSPAADTLGAIRQRSVLTWGADAEGGAPYVFPDPQEPGRMTGFEYELAQALAVQLRIKAQMVQNSWDGLVPALQRGDFDIILNGMEITDEHR